MATTPRSIENHLRRDFLDPAQLSTFSYFAQPDRPQARLWLSCSQLSGNSIVVIRDEVTANLCVSARMTIAQKIERSGGLLAACLELIEPLFSAVNDRRGIPKSKLLLDLNEAQTIFGIDRDILLTAMVNHELPSFFTAKGHRIKYKDLEQFVDRYYYRKNSILDGYCPNSDL